MSIPFFLVWGLAVLIQIGFPILLGIWFAKRYGVRVAPFLYGAAIFLVFQLLTRVPAVQLLSQAIGQRLLAGPRIGDVPVLQILYLLFLALTAGLFESVGRWVGYRFLFRNRLTYNWKNGVAYGIGHGGFESVMLVGVNQLISLVLVVIVVAVGVEGLSSVLPPELAAELGNVPAQLAGTPWYALLAGAYERVVTIVFHTGLSLVVLLCFTRGQSRWLWVAVAIHAFVDFTGPGMYSLLGWPIWVVEGYLTLWGLAALWLILRLRGERLRGEGAGSEIVEGGV